MSFKAEQIAKLAGSGWSRCESVAEAVAGAGLPAVTPAYLASAFSDDLWDAAERAVLALRDHFASARFADETTYGILLVPDPGKLDTRGPMAAGVRRDQLGVPTADVFDERLRAGVLGVRHGTEGRLSAMAGGGHLCTRLDPPAHRRGALCVQRAKKSPAWSEHEPQARMARTASDHYRSAVDGLRR